MDLRAQVLSLTAQVERLTDLVQEQGEAVANFTDRAEKLDRTVDNRFHRLRGRMARIEKVLPEGTGWTQGSLLKVPPRPIKLDLWYN